jgi:hypothetical protein
MRPSGPVRRSPSAVHRRRRLAALAVVAGVAILIVVVLSQGGGGPGTPRPFAPGAGIKDPTLDPLAYDPARVPQFEQRAATGFSHVLYAKSPGGVVASAKRTARFRPLIDRVARSTGWSADTLEGIVFLESAGRPDAIASNDLNSAVGLTQILAETGQHLLGMHVDVRASESLSRGIARGHRVAARQAARRRADERFDPAKAIAATARYLTFAKGKLGRDDLAIASYHMGVGNLQQALSAYGQSSIPYAELYFDSSPLRHPTAWRKLASLGDDSSTYLWRVLAAEQIMRLYRTNPAELAIIAQLQMNKASSEEVLHPAATTVRFGDPFAIGRARAAGQLVPLDRNQFASHGLRIDRGMGATAKQIKQSPSLYRGLRPEALATLLTLGAGTKAIAKTGTLDVTSTVRDERFQKALATDNVEATHAYSMHTTGWAFDIARVYSSPAQAMAFQFMLDRMTALGLIAWVREPGAIHVAVSSLASELLSNAARLPGG